MTCFPFTYTQEAASPSQGIAWHGMKSNINLSSVSGWTNFQKRLLKSWFLLEAYPKMLEMKGTIMLQNYIAKNVTVSIQRHRIALGLQSLEYFSCVGEWTGQETVNHLLEKLSHKSSWDQKNVGCPLSPYGASSPWKFGLKEKPSWTELHRTFEKCMR